MTTERIVQHSIPINIIHDTLEVIATKKQYAKRAAFAALNTELADDTTYVIRTSAEYKPNVPPLAINGEPLVTGDGTFTYAIRYVEWGDKQ